MPVVSDHGGIQAVGAVDTELVRPALRRGVSRTERAATSRRKPRTKRRANKAQRPAAGRAVGGGGGRAWRGRSSRVVRWVDRTEGERERASTRQLETASRPSIGRSISPEGGGGSGSRRTRGRGKSRRGGGRPRFPPRSPPQAPRTCHVTGHGARGPRLRRDLGDTRGAWCGRRAPRTACGRCGSRTAPGARPLRASSLPPPAGPIERNSQLQHLTAARSRTHQIVETH